MLVRDNRACLPGTHGQPPSHREGASQHTHTERERGGEREGGGEAGARDLNGLTHQRSFASISASHAAIWLFREAMRAKAVAIVAPPPT